MSVLQNVCRQEDDRYEIFKNEPRQAFGSLTCIIINRPYLASSRKYLRMVWSMCCGQVHLQWLPDKKQQRIGWFPLPRTIIMLGWRARPVVRKGWKIHSWSPIRRYSSGSEWREE